MDIDIAAEQLEAEGMLRIDRTYILLRNRLCGLFNRHRLL
jgi:hypothetical protein